MFRRRHLKTCLLFTATPGFSSHRSIPRLTTCRAFPSLGALALGAFRTLRPCAEAQVCQCHVYQVPGHKRRTARDLRRRCGRGKRILGRFDILKCSGTERKDCQHQTSWSSSRLAISQPFPEKDGGSHEKASLDLSSGRPQQHRQQRSRC